MKKYLYTLLIIIVLIAGYFMSDNFLSKNQKEINAKDKEIKRLETILNSFSRRARTYHIATKESNTLKVIDNSLIDGNMKLFNDGVKVIFAKGKKLYSLKMKEK